MKATRDTDGLSRFGRLGRVLANLALVVGSGMAAWDGGWWGVAITTLLVMLLLREQKQRRKDVRQREGEIDALVKALSDPAPDPEWAMVDWGEVCRNMRRSFEVKP